MSRREKKNRDVFDTMLIASCELTPKQKSKYIDKKFRMIHNDFKLPVYPADIDYLNTLTTADEIDRACSRIIRNRL